MNFKKLNLQCTLILFIIGLSSCEKNINNNANEQISFQKEIVENTNAKIDNRKTIEFALHLDNKIPIEKTFRLLENFLQKDNLALYIKDMISTDKSVFHQFIYNQENGQFEELDFTIGINKSTTPLTNHLITSESIDWNINIYQNTRLFERGGPVTTVLVVGNCPIDCYDCLCLEDWLELK